MNIQRYALALVAAQGVIVTSAIAQDSGSGYSVLQLSGEGNPQEETGYSLNEIIVTAQKREQSINDVGLSITALSGEILERRAIDDAYDLVKLVPGLSVANAGNGATVVYTLRGIGFNSSNLNASPTVSVYTDEVALPFPAMTAGAALDIGRVEVLKGPQGTLYGQSTTAGAINYIAARPTDYLSAGIKASFGRFAGGM